MTLTVTLRMFHIDVVAYLSTMRYDMCRHSTQQKNFQAAFPMDAFKTFAFNLILQLKWILQNNLQWKAEDQKERKRKEKYDLLIHHHGTWTSESCSSFKSSQIHTFEIKFWLNHTGHTFMMEDMCSEAVARILQARTDKQLKQIFLCWGQKVYCNPPLHYRAMTRERKILFLAIIMSVPGGQNSRRMSLKRRAMTLDNLQKQTHGKLNLLSYFENEMMSWSWAITNSYGIKI